MTAFRGAIPDFQLANPIYVSAQVSFFAVDEDGARTTTLATLYAAPTGTATVANPQTLDSEGKFSAPVYIGTPVIAEVTSASTGTHSTGIIAPRGTWRGEWATGTVYFTNDFVRNDDSSVIYCVADDYESGASIAADLAAGHLEKVIDLAAAADIILGNGGFADFRSVAVATAATLTVLQVYFRTAGYYAAGDGGGALYKRVSSGTYQITTADGSHWALVHEGKINVKCLGATDDGVNCSAAVDAAITLAAGKAMVYFPTAVTSFKFSVDLDENDATIFCGEGIGSKLVPNAVGTPCFKLGYTAAFPRYLQYKFRDLFFADPGTKTCAGIWAAYSAEVTDCFFENLKYGIIYNTGEWPQHYGSYFAGCQFGVYATASNASHDPLGFTSGTFNSNPSEKYFHDCWFNNNDNDYYEDQPDNTFDRTSFVRFEECTFTQGQTNVVVIDVYEGSVSFDSKCWFEGRTGSETGITVRAKVIPPAIVYTEGVSVEMKSTSGLYVENPIIIKLSAYNTATKNPPRFTCDSPIQNGVPTTFDEGVISRLNNTSAYANGGADLSGFSIVENVVPQLPLTNSGITFPAKVWPVIAVQGSATGPFENLWTKGSCMGAASNFFGTPTSSTITAGDGFICSAFNTNKYLAVVGCANAEGPHTGAITTVTGKIYLVSFAIRQAHGSTKRFRIYGPGATDGPNPFSVVNVKTGRWQAFIGISGCLTGGAAGYTGIINDSGGTINFDLSAIQLIKFDTLEQAIQYANSGLYTVPATP